MDTRHCPWNQMASLQRYRKILKRDGAKTVELLVRNEQPESEAERILRILQDETK